jgi:hypothetical protein
MTKKENWPFLDPKNVAVYTEKKILHGDTILCVLHDDDDGAWQFHSGIEMNIGEAAMVSLAEMVTIDSSILLLANLPLGWIATRESKDDAWQYFQMKEKSVNDLPSIEVLKSHLQSTAVLDSILSPEWEDRYYSFNNSWDKDVALSTIRNGSGDHLFSVFCPNGCLVKGFDHEASSNLFNTMQPHTWEEILNFVPFDFRKYLGEVSLIPEETTFCIWRNFQDTSWNSIPMNFSFGSRELLLMLNANEQEYHKWAEEYYETTIDIKIIEHVFARKVLNQDTLLNINNQLVTEKLYQELQEIGYIHPI